MLLALGLLALGAATIYAGAEAAIRGVSGQSRALGVPAFVLGALLFGIDLEGLGGAVAASARGDPGLAVGEIFGAVLFLFSAAFGAALLSSRRPVPSPGTLMVLAPAPALAAASMVLADRYVGRLEGALLVLLYTAYVALIVVEGRMARVRGEALLHEGGAGPGRVALAGLSLAGLVTLAVGAAVIVAGAGRLAEETQLSAGFVGAAILGVVVSLDEVLLEVLPIRRGTPDLATGNLFGTLAAFSSGVLGVAALVRPLVVDSAANLAVIGSAVLYGLVGTVFLVRGRAGPGLGVAVLTMYAVWLMLASGV